MNQIVLFNYIAYKINWKCLIYVEKLSEFSTLIASCDICHMLRRHSYIEVFPVNTNMITVNARVCFQCLCNLKKYNENMRRELARLLYILKSDMNNDIAELIMNMIL